MAAPPQDTTPSRTAFTAGFLENGEGVNNNIAERCMRLLTDLDDIFSKATFFVMCTPHGLDKLDSEILRCGCVIVSPVLTSNPVQWQVLVLTALVPLCLGACQENFDFARPWNDPDGLLPLSQSQTAKLEG